MEFRLQDYREAASDPQTYDRVVSIGLMEHVGPKNYRRFFEIARARLAPGGLALVHTIGGNVSMATTDRWISRYIFPGGVIPSEQQLTAAKEGLFVLEDWHNFGPDYDRTLLAWDENFRPQGRRSASTRRWTNASTGCGATTSTRAPARFARARSISGSSC